MKITLSALRFFGVALAFSFCIVPLSYSADETPSASRQQFLAIVNLQEEGSANTVIQNNGVIEFKGNELVDSVATQMSANGTLPPDSALALPKNDRNMTRDAKTASTPLALVEKDLQGWANTGGVELNAIVGNATKITQTPFVIPRSNIASSVSSNLGSGLGTGGSNNKR